MRSARKSLPPQLFYDAQGSLLFERITTLPEYYLTRAERSIFETQSDAIVAAARARCHGRLTVVELGAGSAEKSQTIVRALAAAQGETLFVPCDVSLTALQMAVGRFGERDTSVRVKPHLGTHEQTLAWAKELPRPLAVMFIGSSIGNYEPAEAVALLARVRETLGESGVLLLGADLRKAPEVLVRAYDDAQGVTAAFNKNALARINRELGADFDLDRFRHVALWNEQDSRIEMHLESTIDQSVRIEALDMRVRFSAGERIHTESSHKYDASSMARMLSGAGLRLAQTFTDERGQFAVYLAEPLKH